jgi:hypothetical protein
VDSYPRLDCDRHGRERQPMVRRWGILIKSLIDIVITVKVLTRLNHSNITNVIVLRDATPHFHYFC